MPFAPTSLAIVLVAVLPAMLSAEPPKMSSMQAEYDPLDIGAAEQRFLTQLIRRTLEAKLNNDPTYQPAYVPPPLVDTASQMVVILRIDGYARGIGVSLRQPIIEATQEAALVALSSARSSADAATFALDRVRIDVQVLGRVQLFHSTTGGWMSPNALEQFLDPGRDGVGLFLDGERRWCTPSEMIAQGVNVRNALEILGKEITLDSRSLIQAKLSKFRTLHWWEIEVGGDVQKLQRGMVHVPLASITRNNLDDAIQKLGDYLIYRQRPDATFAVRYDPSSDSYAAKENEVAQSGATWAMGFYAKHTKSSAARTAFARAVRIRRGLVVDFPAVDNAAFLVTADRRNKLATTAQFCLALADSPNPTLDANLRTRLANAMIWLEQPSGRFITVFPPNRKLESQDVAPGQAVLALTRCYELDPSQHTLEAIERAFGFYRKHFEDTGSPAMVPWHMQAYARMARLTKKGAYREFVFKMADQVCDHQITMRNSDAPILVGAIVAPGVLPPNAGTAAMLSGLADAAELAQDVGDVERFHRYVEACRLAARFVMQLQIREEECYFIRSLPDAVNGIRTSPMNWRIRLDNCQHALIGLIKARQVLFPDPS
ncbi:MAG: hypothetical protein GXP29_04360 [Planctomycetes bacterium]|nr:hypothetical protein [Planctomycetota bacterium]